jgi:signal transduction histidine kinase
VDLAALVQDAVTALRPSAMAKGLRVEVQVADGLPTLRGRRGPLFQAVANLVDNAIKYSPPRGVIEVDVGPGARGEPRLVVRDHGPGLPDEGLAHLFDRFRQGAPSPHSPRQGVGVGLYVVKSAVESQGGSVQAGNHPAGGARFECRFVAWEEVP